MPRVRLERLLQRRDQESPSGGGLQHAPAFPKQGVELVHVKMLEKMTTINTIDALRRKGQAIAQIQSHVHLPPEVHIDVQKALGVLGSATEMQIDRLTVLLAT